MCLHFSNDFISLCFFFSIYDLLICICFCCHSTKFNSQYQFRVIAEQNAGRIIWFFLFCFDRANKQLSEFENEMAWLRMNTVIKKWLEGGRGHTQVAKTNERTIFRTFFLTIFFLLFFWFRSFCFCKRNTLQAINSGTLGKKKVFHHFWSYPPIQACEVSFESCMHLVSTTRKFKKRSRIYGR